ncbi:MAG: RagB/SusD family nutrient uptake outer membrane protein [Muribaculaceae bacterium]|nr:RagB/SusD family nutrient uptake outer membrane protein [Muribaculaceae bacterium]
MKLKNIFKFAAVAVASGAMLTGITSCDYLDVVPPEQPSLPDAMKDHDKALGFLYSCYAGLNTANMDYRGYYGGPTFNNTTDEYVIPEGWMDSEHVSFAIMRNTISSSQIGNWEWGHFYRFIGQCILFEDQLASVGKQYQVWNDENERKGWLAETQFLKAAYHFFMLRQYGPIPITTELIPMTSGLSAYNGRSHYDYCTDYIVDQLDKAADTFKEIGMMERPEAEGGRASYVICKALKARVLLYAASDLWNGSYPYAGTWKNTKFETKKATSDAPEARYVKDYTKPATGDNLGSAYGKELVSREFNASKWARAYTATKEAIQIAEGLGYKLWTDSIIPSDEKDVLPSRIYIPRYEGQEFASPEEKLAFQQKVATMRYAVSTSEFEGNHEIIWSNKTEPSFWIYARVPKNIFTTAKGTIKTGYGGFAPTLESIEAFLTQDGTVPAEDPHAIGVNSEADFYTKVDNLTPTDVQSRNRTELMKICMNREPRFYAWIGFHHGDFLTRLNDGNPKILDFVKQSEEGREEGGGTVSRNYSATGFLSMKHLDPNLRFTSDNENAQSYQLTQSSPNVLIRLAELYLTLAECAVECYDNNLTPELATGDLRQEAIDMVNKIRNRAGAHPLTEEIIAKFKDQRSLLEWVRHERRIEFWNEGQRYFDVRRWVQGEKYFGADKRHGLNGAGFNKKFDDWCKVVNLDPQFRFHNRLYLSPCFLNEVYKNPQMVQAPGY